jgi:hypothetical protein
MQYTKNKMVNQRIDEVNQWIKQWLPSIQAVDRIGFRSTSYFLQKGMQHERVYIICYDQKANLGFAQGVHLSKIFPFLEGKGKTHRHIDIMAAQVENSLLMKKLIFAAFEVN